MRYMKYAGALVRPKDITRYSYSPYLEEKAVFGMSVGLIFIG
jgi:negative regulator of sigma E activity